MLSSCAVERACWNGDRWYYKSRNLADETFRAHAGSYSSSPLISIRPKVDSGGSGGAGVKKEERLHSSDVAILFYGSSRMYWHFIADELFSLWWIKHWWGIDDSSNVSLIFVDGKMSVFRNILEDLKFNVELLPSPPTSLEPVCFNQVYFGPASHQLGGPGLYQIKQEDVSEFSQWVKKIYKEKEETSGEEEEEEGGGGQERDTRPLILIENRLHSRKILNLNDLVDSIREEFSSESYSIEAVSLSEKTPAEQHALLRRTAILVAVHGSAMSNLLFLPESAAVVELFPYGFTRPTFQMLLHRFLHSHSPHLRYYSWQNTNRETSVFHPDLYLSTMQDEERRKEIIEAERFDTTSMPWVANLYWINQDQHVDSKAITKLVREAVNEREKGVNQFHSEL